MAREYFWADCNSLCPKCAHSQSVFQNVSVFWPNLSKPCYVQSTLPSQEPQRFGKLDKNIFIWATCMYKLSQELKLTKLSFKIKTKNIKRFSISIVKLCHSATTAVVTNLLSTWFIPYLVKTSNTFPTMLKTAVVSYQVLTLLLPQFNEHYDLWVGCENLVHNPLKWVFDGFVGKTIGKAKWVHGLSSLALWQPSWHPFWIITAATIKSLKQKHKYIYRQLCIMCPCWCERFKPVQQTALTDTTMKQLQCFVSVFCI